MVLAMYFLPSKGCWFILEQPASSIMNLHPRVRQLAAKLGDNGLKTTQTYMGAFGGETAKRTMLWSDRTCVTKLTKTLDKNFKKTKTLANIDLERKKKRLPCVTGNKYTLKSSQAYHENYGKAVVKVFAEEYPRDEIMEDLEELDTYMPQTIDLWSDAWAKEILDNLTLPINRLAQAHCC